MHQQQIKGYLAAAISAISFGLIPLFVVPLKRAGIAMDVILFYRFFLGAVLIGLYLIARKQYLGIPWKSLPLLAVMGVFYALSAEFLFLGYDLMSVGVASTLIYTYPIIVAVILHFGFGDKLSTLTKISIGLATLGVVCMGWEESEMRFDVYGTFMVLLGSTAYALYMILVNKGNLRITGIKLTFYSLFFSAIFYGIKAGLTSQTLVLASPYWLSFIGGFSLVTTVLSVLMMVIAIQLIGSAPTAVLGSLEPVVAVAIAVVIFGERITWNLILGLLFIISALMVSIPRKKEEAPVIDSSVSPSSETVEYQ